MAARRSASTRLGTCLTVMTKLDAWGEEDSAGAVDVLKVAAGSLVSVTRAGSADGAGMGGGVVFTLATSGSRLVCRGGGVALGVGVGCVAAVLAGMFNPLRVPARRERSLVPSLRGMSLGVLVSVPVVVSDAGVLVWGAEATSLAVGRSGVGVAAATTAGSGVGSLRGRADGAAGCATGGRRATSSRAVFNSLS
jgi:hypothetical protein